MSEISKLYENCGIKKVRQTNIAGGNYPIAVGFEDYPPFTAEKQLKIMELLVRKGMLLFTFSTKGNYKVSGFCRGSNYCSDINEAFANYINTLWQDLTEEERKQIKEILE